MKNTILTTSPRERLDQVEKRISIRLIDVSAETSQARGEWADIFKVLKMKKYREFNIIMPALEERLKGVLPLEVKGK
jgi:hypothetical protein